MYGLKRAGRLLAVWQLINPSTISLPEVWYRRLGEPSLSMTLAAPVSLVSPESIGLSTPVEKATYCPRRHVRRAARCCEY